MGFNKEASELCNILYILLSGPGTLSCKGIILTICKVPLSIESDILHVLPYYA